MQPARAPRLFAPGWPGGVAGPQARAPRHTDLTHVQLCRPSDSVHIHDPEAWDSQQHSFQLSTVSATVVGTTEGDGGVIGNDTVGNGGWDRIWHCG